MKTLKAKKMAELQVLKQKAEGEEEKHLFRSRYGYTWNDGNSKGNSQGRQIATVQEFLHWIICESKTPLPKPSSCLACLTGPPASGKTVTMLQIVHAAVRECIAQMEKEDGMPLLPVFVRAAELSNLMSNSDSEAVTLRQLLALFLSDSILKEKFPKGVDDLILELFDLNWILICIDGLDEAATHQERVEASIENAVADASESRSHVHLLLSTREHSFVHSCACLRLLDFNVVNLQPLDLERQLKMMQGRIPSENVETFKQQLQAMKAKNSELATSPFRSSLPALFFSV